MEGILAEIVAYKKKELDSVQQVKPIAELEADAIKVSNQMSFYDSLLPQNANEIRVIAEVKKASPSKGIISANFNPLKTAQSYEKNGAAAVSVLTEKKYFQGSPEYLQKISKAISIPCLRKDFIFSEYQILEAKLWGASAYLLIVDCLDEKQLKHLIQFGKDRGLDALVEVHRREEVEIAVNSGAKIIGVNNRNLRTFETQLETSLELANHIPKDMIRVSESGIRTRSDIEQLLQAHFQAVLVGETLMRESEEMLQNLIKAKPV